MKAAIVLAMSILGIPTVSQAFIADNGLRVVRTSNEAFEVPYRGLSGAADFWCAAGDYVINRMHQNPSTRIYRTSSIPRRAGQGISFSLLPDGAKRTGLAMFGDPRSVSAAHAHHLCEQRRLLLEDFD